MESQVIEAHFTGMQADKHQRPACGDPFYLTVHGSRVARRINNHLWAIAVGQHPQLLLKIGI
ncbi:hypothetical protein D3C73_1283930 [compost metagenome]